VLFEVIEASMINNLSNEFDGGLGAVAIELRHVDIINEHDHFPSGGRSDDFFGFGLELVFIEEEVLDIAGAGLCAEVEIRIDIVGLFKVGNEVLDDNAFSGSSFSTNKDIEAVFEEVIKDELDSGSILSGNKDIEEGDVFVVFPVRQEVVPGAELFFGEVGVVVINLVFIGEAGEEFLELSAHGL